MRSLVGLVAFTVSMTTMLAVASAGDDDEEYVDGVVKYKWGGVSALESTPAAACQDGVKELAKNGNKQTYVSVKDGPADAAETCVLKGTDNKNWDELNLVAKVLVCPATTSPRSTDNSGVFKTERCHCDADTGCPTVKKVPPPINYCDKSKVKKNDPSRAPISADDAKLQSQAQQTTMRTEASSHADKHGILWHYNQQKDKVRGDKGRFPTFDPATDLYKGRPNDVNIGTLCGTREQDFAAANAAAGLKCTPDGYEWHHHQTMGRMQLVKSSAHKDEDHTGGVGIWNQAFCVQDKPTDPKPNPAQCGYKTEGAPQKSAPCTSP